MKLNFVICSQVYVVCGDPSVLLLGSTFELHSKDCNTLQMEEFQ